MKKLLFILFVFLLVSFLATTASSAGASPAAQTELGQLKVCKAGGSGVTQGQLFTIRVGSTNYSVPAGYCVLAGQFALDTQVTIQEIIPNGYDVLAINVRPDSRVVSRDLPAGSIVVRIGSGVTEVIYTNWPTGISTPTPRPTSTPNTGTPEPTGRLQICKEAADPSVTGDFMFRFQSRSFRVLVGACSVLVHANAGTLTITEDARSGYSVEDIYTIPSSRLISKDLNGRSATVQIVEGTAASQTIIVFRNRSVTTATSTPTATSTATGSVTPTTTATSTPTPTGTLTVTATNTPTPTGTLTVTATSTPTATATNTPTATPTGTVTVCPPIRICADFSQIFAPGDSVEGLGAVAPYLNIDAAVGTAVKIEEDQDPFQYRAGTAGTVNGGIAMSGGFGVDPATQQSGQPYLYTFTFAPGVSVTDFMLHMLDYGDLNPNRDTEHYVSMTAYDANGGVVAIQELSYTTDNALLPTTSDKYGNPQVSGDALTATSGQPGNWTWHVAGQGIVRIVLAFGVGQDPNIGFDGLCFTAVPVDCPSCQAFEGTADLSKIAVGDPLEGFGVIAPFISINAKGTAVRIAEGQDPFQYRATGTGSSIVNGGIVPGGGFGDSDTQLAADPHLYTFSFALGISVRDFSLRMLDYGDFNPNEDIEHLVNMTAYNAGGSVVSTQELSYTTDAQLLPSTSDKYGNLQITGDALGATPGQPGNWTWRVTGNGIVKIVLEFGLGHDPNIGFDQLTFTCQ